MKTYYEAYIAGDCMSCERCEIICKESGNCYKSKEEEKEHTLKVTEVTNG